MQDVFASDPFVVGNNAPAPAAPHIPAEEALCPVVCNDWVNPEYKHLIVKASPKALKCQPGQFFNMLCPSPDDGELWLRRPQSIYRIDRPRGRSSSSTNASGAARAAWRPSNPATSCNMVGPLGVGFTLKPEMEEHRGARPRRRARDHGTDLAARGGERRRRHGNPLGPQRRTRDGGQICSRKVGEVMRGARHRWHQRGGECRSDPRTS